MAQGFTHVLGRGVVVWLIIMIAEILHGLARKLLLEPRIGDFRARQVSVFVGAAMILAITFVFVRWLKASYLSHFVLLGFMWVGLTLGFEILLGRVIMDLSWERILSDYDVANGGLMLFGLLVMAFAPSAMAKIVDEI